MTDSQERPVNLREYDTSDEDGWVRCRVLSFLDTSYYDDVHREKEQYENPSIELVAEYAEQIVGLIDVELDTPDRSVCSDRDGRGGMIWHLAVHPDYQRQGIASALLHEVIQRAKRAGVNRLEAWTRDDEGTVLWYENRQFERRDSYLHVYLNREEADRDTDTVIEGLSINSAFAQYIGEDDRVIKERYNRVHECQMFELQL